MGSTLSSGGKASVATRLSILFAGYPFKILQQSFSNVPPTSWSNILQEKQAVSFQTQPEEFLLRKKTLQI